MNIRDKAGLIAEGRVAGFLEAVVAFEEAAVTVAFDEAVEEVAVITAGADGIGSRGAVVGVVEGGVEEAFGRTDA